MTVFKAKGLEFEHVFLLNCQDDVWGSSVAANSNKLTLPPNLRRIRHAGATEDERLRIFFVAITRAKSGLYLTSSAQSYTGKASRRLKYLDEEEQSDGSFKALALPTPVQAVQKLDHDAPTLALLELDWRTRHMEEVGLTQLSGLLSSRLENYQLSPTHLNSFTDMEYGGPAVFFFNTLLRFPQAPTLSSQFGNAIHETMEWIQHRSNETGNVPDTAAIVKQFGVYMRGKKLMPAQLTLELARGTRALEAYMAARGTMFQGDNQAEYNFKREGVLIGDVHLSGKIDRMEIDKKAKTIVVVDYKTGRGYTRWEKTLRLHKYAQQLYCYKLLIEGSHTFKGYTVIEGRLEFIEPDQEGKVHSLPLSFNTDELARTKRLLQVMWEHVMQLNLPDTGAYPDTLAGTLQFEDDLIEGKI
jgi:DNA helicase-2/ATP-dependent DNA helicase PcrA